MSTNDVLRNYATDLTQEDGENEWNKYAKWLVDIVVHQHNQGVLTLNMAAAGITSQLQLALEAKVAHRVKTTHVIPTYVSALRHIVGGEKSVENGWE